MPHKTKTAGQASKLLAEYEHLNTDLPRNLRRQLAIFVLAPRVGTPILEELFQRPLAQTPLRHRSWLWYTAMRTSGLERYWPELVSRRNSGEPFGTLLRWLRSQATEEEWALMGNRLGKRINPAHWSWKSSGKPTNYWTKGGVWDRRNNFTRIIILGESLDGERDHTYSTLTQAITPASCRLLERELHNTIDEETLLFPDAIHQAVAYTRARIPQLAGHKINRASYKTAAWFFQTHVPDASGKYFYRHIDDACYRREFKIHNRLIRWEWFPSE